MDGQLVAVSCPEDSSSELIHLVTRWRQELAELRAEVQGLRRENLELRQQVGYWKSRHRDALGRVTALGQKLTAPPPPKLIPKGRYGISVWVEILLDKYFSYRPTERLLASWRLLGLDLAPGTVTDGLSRLGVLLGPIYRALRERNRLGDLHQGDETRWPVFVALEGKEGYGWWLWVVLGPDTVVYLLDAGRGHTVPEDHYRADPGRRSGQ